MSRTKWQDTVRDQETAIKFSEQQVRDFPALLSNFRVCLLENDYSPICKFTGKFESEKEIANLLVHSKTFEVDGKGRVVSHVPVKVEIQASYSEAHLYGITSEIGESSPTLVFPPAFLMRTLEHVNSLNEYGENIEVPKSLKYIQTTAPIR